MSPPIPLTRRQVMKATALGLAAAGPWAASARAEAADAAPAEAEPHIDGDTAWYDVTQWGVEGRGWADQERERYFDRFPTKAEGKVRPPVWSLSRHSAGMSVRFATDSNVIRVRYKLLSPGLAMPHMPATGMSGVDLYATDDKGRWRWAGVVKPTNQMVEATVISGIAPGSRRYTMYLPLYNGVDAMEVGVSAKAAFDAEAPRTDKPIVFYGTSIMQGGVASRPGMLMTAILDRRLNRPTINLGFSGNGTMDMSVADLLVELDAAVFVIDCVPNMNAKQVTERTGPMVERLRSGRADAAIVLVEDRRNTSSWLLPARKAHHDANHAALRAEYDKLIAAGMKRLYYLPGDGLLGDDGEAATDGSHPSDLGMMRYADAYEPVLRRALKEA
jgi:lysophospholipase L1-like esterase